MSFEGTWPRIFRMKKISVPGQEEVKGFDYRRPIKTAKPLVHPLYWVVLPVTSPWETVLAGHPHPHDRKTLVLMLMKQFSQRIKFFLKLISWKLTGTLRTETVLGFLISFLDGLVPHRDTQGFGETHRGSSLDVDTSWKQQAQANCVGAGFLS